MPRNTDTTKEPEEKHTHADSAEGVTKALEGSANQISIIRLVDNLISSAYELRASDVHIDPEDKEIRVRFRIDGVLHDNFIIPKELHSEIITRIKILSALRTDEHAAAQDGRFKIAIAGHNQFIDVRVSIAPTYYGENCVMRLLAGASEELSLESLGYSKFNLEKVNRAMKKPYGLILATGPTGSGKTTSLYAILKKLNTKDVSIITVEDPIEYSIQGIDQIQVNPHTGLTFAQGLRFILRQDPNIIMVGEIRDNETASIAVNAAMTGHLVLSTLHTNDAATTLPRLLDMGVEPFLITSTVNVAIGQRLVRTLCPDCKVERELSEGQLESLKGFAPAEFLKGSQNFSVGIGCKKCDMSGFKGRIGIHEVLEITDEIRELIMKRANSKEVRDVAIKNGMITMLQDGLEKARAGLTTIEEVLRVFHE
jgi:type IV pilus assembly protein PilB